MDYKLELQNNNIDLQTILDTINNLPEKNSGGSTSTEDAIITKTITEYSNDRITNVEAYAFYDCKNLISVDLPNVTTIGNSVFRSCDNLTSVSLPNLIIMGNETFYLCDKLTSLELPKVTTLGNSTFNSCINLTFASMPNLITTGDSTFRECDNLTSIDLPNLTTIGDSTFSGCSNLISVDLWNVEDIGERTFYNCGVLISVILRKNNSICTLSGINAFGSTGTVRPPVAYGTGYIYVPSALINSYKTDTNWSTYANQFRALEDYTIDGTITGALDVTKI